MPSLEEFLTRHRTALLVGVGLPVGFVFDAVLRARARIREFFGAPERHDERVRDVQEQVRRWAAQPDGERKPMCTDRRTWQNLSTRFEPKHRWEKIRMGSLHNVLELDEDKMTVRVEPFVTVGQLARFLNKRGYMLAVHLEIADATIGGLALAAGMTTHSHRVGMLFETIRAWDVVTADGELRRVTEESDSDLYRALPWSHGTLGLLVALELDIIKIKPYVHMRYIPMRTQDDYCAEMYRLATADDAPDFLEATVFSKHEAVIMAADFADVDTAEKRRKVNRIGRWYKPWFYKHVETYLDGDGGDEYIPLQHYLLRHNRSIFWVVAHMIPMGNHPLFRALMGWLMPVRIAFLKFSTTPAVRKMTYTMQVFQDIVLPMSAMKRAVNKADEIFEMFPILLYPSRVYDHGEAQGQLRQPAPEDIVPGTNHAMYFDLGVYGVPGPIVRGRAFRTVHAMREMEAFTQSVRGFPFLYADTFMTEEEFGAMFDLRLYTKVRAAVGADGAFPDLYTKIKPEVDVFETLREEEALPIDIREARGAAE
jgi:delta24-sterol reductase